MTNIFNTNSIFEKITVLTVMVGVVLLFSPASIFAQNFNKEINYQGKLADNNGSTVADGDYDITFRLYDASTGGTQLWDEVRSSSGGDGPAVSVSNGLFSVRLGRYDNLDSVDFNQGLWLSIEVEGDGEMTPRKKLTTVPSAFEAQNAQELGGVASSSFFRSDQADKQEANSSQTMMEVVQNGVGDVFKAMGAAVGLVVKQDGDVGVGTTTPSDQLTVDGNTTITKDLTVDGGDIVSSGNLDIGDNNNEVSLNNGALTVTNSGNVGIGDSNPSNALSVSGNIEGTGNLQIGGDSISNFTGDNLSVSGGTLSAATTTDTTLTEDETESYIFDADNTGTLSSGTLDFSSLSYSGTLGDSEINESSLDTSDFNNDAGFISDPNDTVSGPELDNLFSSNGFVKRTGNNTYGTVLTLGQRSG
jgi:hypothetical protein